MYFSRVLTKFPKSCTLEKVYGWTAISLENLSVVIPVFSDTLGELENLNLEASF